MVLKSLALSVPLLLTLAVQPVSAQSATEMRLDARTGEVGIEIDGTYLGRWPLDLANYPKDITLPVEKAAPSTICFTNEDRRACAAFVPGQTRGLEITFNGGTIATTIKAQRSTPQAVFSADYQAAYRGRTVVEVPEVYELVNIAIAITPFGQADDDMVYHYSPYFKAVQARFKDHVNHPLIQRLDAMLRADRSDYFPFKMNGYAFVFDDAGTIVRSPVYDRTGFPGALDNAVLPYLEDLQDFARKSGFRDFYRENRSLYEQQIRFFEEEAQVARITTWLSERFPSVKPYDGVKIIFSPLVAYNQSLTTIEADGYRELQPHINYPYDASRGLTPAGAAIQRTAILFTEMNHGYINPTALKHRERIEVALKDRSQWADDTKAPRYYPGSEALFNEYMNWALTSLYYRDLMSDADFAIAHKAMVVNMQEGRGFLKFAAFDAELLRLYTNRKPDQTVEELYPAIIAWMEGN
jgi:hypothetical protein